MSGKTRPQQGSRQARAPRPRHTRGAAAVFLLILTTTALAASPRQSTLTPQQHAIEVERARLSSADVEERRDAVMRLGAMGRPEASRAAAAALADTSPVVRATAARAILSLGPGETSTLILPLLRDRDEFVRREAAYALGFTRSHVGVAELIRLLEADKQASVRAAAAVALGQIGDPSAATALAGALARRLPARGLLARITRRRVEEDEFVRRASAVSLGQLRSREAVPVLITTLSDERAPADVRREAARALGLIGDPSAEAALRAAVISNDPHLATTAFEALRKLGRAPGGPT